MSGNRLTAEDRARIVERGLTTDEVERQLALLRDPPPPTRLERPCTVGDGIVQLEGAARSDALEAWSEAADMGRIAKFVPASGAATRMFKNLLEVMNRTEHDTLQSLRSRADTDDAARDVVRFVDNLERFAFRAELWEAARGAGDGDRLRAEDGVGYVELLRAMMGPEGLDYARLPKGIISYHRYEDGPRTAFEEQLVEAAGYARDGSGACRMHVTISAEHAPSFRERLARARETLEPRLGVRFEVAMSQQSPSTDTVAIDERGQPFRTTDGQLLFRPGGHGALIGNLDRMGADVVIIKNIDNVVRDERKGPTLAWKKLLTGHLLRLQSRVFGYLERLESAAEAGVIEEAAHFVATALSVPATGGADGDLEARRAFLIDRLDRPLRACGVVRNEGEPGGGPFWVREEDGAISPQIVESSEFDASEAGQQVVWSRSTHFNPVDLVCSVRDRRGRPYELERFVDPRKVFVTKKSSGGRSLLALERPGLWNGAMARWNTVFVEVPIETFAPVKTVFDLLRDEHQ